MSREKIYQNPREEILKKTAEEMELPLDEVEKVVSWSYMKANKAMKEVRHIEVSGLGKFMVSKAKMRRRLKSLNDRLEGDISEERREETIAEIEFIKGKEDEQTQGISGTATQGTKDPGESAGGNI